MRSPWNRGIYLRRPKPRRRHPIDWLAIFRDDDLLCWALIVAVAVGFVAMLFHEAGRM